MHVQLWLSISACHGMEHWWHIGVIEGWELRLYCRAVWVDSEYCRASRMMFGAGAGWEEGH